jgi:molybdate transport system substrate-binding protein
MLRRSSILLLTVVLALAAMAGCGKRGAGPTDGNNVPAQPVSAKGGGLTGELLIWVPCGIAGPYGEIKKLFEQQNPGLKVTQEMANIDVQTKMLLDGKGTPDVWISLGDRELARVAEKGLIEGEPIVYGYNSIAFLVAKNNPSGLDAVTGLTNPKIKTIALPTEENSSGFYGKQAFVKSGVWDKIQDKLWITPEPSSVKTQLAAGKADVGIVYYPCTRETRMVGGKPEELHGKVQLLGKIPAEISGQIPAQAAVVKGCANPEAGKAFLQFMLTEPVQDIWEKWAFDRAVEPASGPRTHMYVYCGAGIRPFMDKAVEAFIAQNSKVRIDVGYAGSGCLLSQLTFARRGDLYIPGEEFYIRQAQDRGYLTSDQLVGFFEPVLLVQKGNPRGITRVQDLTRPGLKVAVGDPEAAAIGYTTDAILKTAGILDAVKKNVVFTAGNVPELGNAVKLKTVDVAVVWRVTAQLVADDCDPVTIDPKLYQPPRIPVGILRFTKAPVEAKAFADFLCGPEGQKLAGENGITPAATGAAASKGAPAAQ